MDMIGDQAGPERAPCLSADCCHERTLDRQRASVFPILIAASCLDCELEHFQSLECDFEEQLWRCAKSLANGKNQ